MFMAGAPVGDVSVHRPRVFYAGSSAMNVKVRASDPKGLALDKVAASGTLRAVMGGKTVSKLKRNACGNWQMNFAYIAGVGI